MAGLINELIDVLTEEISCYEELLKISKGKTDIIVEGDVVSLQNLTSHEQEIVEKTIKLEKKREEIIEDIALVLNENKDTLTISKLLDKLKDTVQESKKLREIQQKIQALISELKRVNDQNRILLNQSIEMIDYTINAIQSKYSYTTNDYSQRGQVQDLEGKSFFDAKQ